MSVIRNVVSFLDAAATKRLSEVPALARKHFDTANWRHHAETGLRSYKKNKIDTGSTHPFLAVVGGMFVFNFIGALPREIAHNEAIERARFH